MRHPRANKTGRHVARQRARRVDESHTCSHEHPGVRTMLLLDIVLLLAASKEAKQ
ncbi:MAG: hypothetical protein ACXVHB_34315 [Solirubrobacteraceae bacterium]